MPTPFYHLALAETMLADDRLPACPRRLLSEQRGPFLFGNTAPDVQTISKQDRTATHFFQIPLRGDTPAERTMFARYPQLEAAAALDPARRAFMAGYICHLLLDQMWIREIFQPVFGLGATWQNLRERLFLHNVLRICLDRQDITMLPPDLPAQLARAEPDGWLPFVEDAHLRAWRDFLAGQLEPGASSRTIEVFAGRMGRDSADFESLLDSPEALRQRLWAHIPEDDLRHFRRRALVKSLELVHSYLDGML